MQYEINVGERVKREILRGRQTFSKNWIRKLDLEPGTLIKIKYGNKFLAWGIINPKDDNHYIRVFSYNENIDIHEEIKNKIKEALKYRERTINYKNHYRLVYSESDFLSGLILDRYNDIFVIQNYNAFFDKNINILKDVLIEVFGNNITIYEKSIGKQRERAFLYPVERFLHGENYTTIIEEEKKKFYVDIIKGQKTGWFLDQRENRKIIKQLYGDKVLDVFSYTGSFGIMVDASYRYFVEKNKEAVKILQKNINMNNIESYEIINDNAYKVLKNFYLEKKKFDIIILDPPDLLADNYEKGIKNFIIINSIALDLIDEGYLVTFSCSQDLKEKKFYSILRTLIRRKNKKFEILYRFHQALDHKAIFPHKELEYLKGFLIEIKK
ncbi:MAG: class I SAM-dependent rRNA methyltransferase [Nanopusillaceae archaeon]